MTFIYPGTFDPITNGHIDILNRALNIFDDITILISYNPSKNTLFTIEERIEIVKHVINDNKIKVDKYTGLLVDYIREHQVKGVIRGLRAVSDFEYEFQMALTNRKMCKDFEVMFFMTDIKYTYLSSSIVKEIARLNGNLNGMVPEYVEKRLKEKFNNVL